MPRTCCSTAARSAARAPPRSPRARTPRGAALELRNCSLGNGSKGGAALGLSELVLSGREVARALRVPWPEEWGAGAGGAGRAEEEAGKKGQKGVKGKKKDKAKAGGEGVGGVGASLPDAAMRAAAELPELGAPLWADAARPGRYRPDPALAAAEALEAARGYPVRPLSLRLRRARPVPARGRRGRGAARSRGGGRAGAQGGGGAAGRSGGGGGAGGAVGGGRAAPS